MNVSLSQHSLLIHKLCTQQSFILSTQPPNTFYQFVHCSPYPPHPFNTRDEPNDEVSGWDTSNSRILINAEEVVNDLKVLLRIPFSESMEQRRKAEAIVNDTYDNDNNINHENDNSNQEEELTFDVRWVPSLLTLSNTDRVMLFSDADVFFAPHGD